MIYDKTWKAIPAQSRLKVLRDFLQLYSLMDRASFVKLGVLHSAGQGIVVLNFLRDNLGLSEITFGLLQSMTNWEQLQTFCYEFLMHGRDIVQCKLVKCITATELDKSSRNLFVQSIGKCFTSGNFAVEYRVDPKIIGGSIVEGDGHRFDSSYISHLTRLEQHWIKLVTNIGGAEV